MYLEIYKGRSILPDGKIKYVRDYEFLNLYLIDKPRTEIERNYNKETYQLANTIRLEKLLEIQTGRFGKQSNKSKNTNFIIYYSNYVDKKRESPGYTTIKGIYNNFVKFAGNNITFGDITEDFCKKYLYHLQTRASKNSNKNLSLNTINSNWMTLNSVLLQSIKDKIISENPLQNIVVPKPKKTKKVYLTMEELNLIISADCKDTELKRAFIFSCLTGLRWSDVYKLKWNEVEESNGKYSIIFKQQKTSEPVYLPISEHILSYLGERGLSNNRIFNLSPYTSSITHKLQDWCCSVGVEKKVTYHSSRHTFAVLQLTMGQKYLHYKNY